MKIFATGTLAFDTLETPFGRKEKILGGSLNYFSIAASMFSPVEACAVVGRDFPRDHLAKLGKRKVGTSNVEITEGDTFHWEGRYEGAMNEAQTINTHLNVLMNFNPCLNDKSACCEVLFLANVDPVIQLKVIEQAKKTKIVITDTMNYWIQSKLDSLKEVFKRTDILIINENEVRMLAGGEINMLKAADAVLKLGPKYLVVKRGEYGSLVIDRKGKASIVPAYPLREVKDPTGAGDTFAGGFTGFLSTQKLPLDIKKIRKAMFYGSVAASFTVQEFGIDALIKVKKTQLDKRYKELIEMCRV
jgi:sugar/nucleoside kinase (ribokinase family)